jgi:hypothetical protein
LNSEGKTSLLISKSNKEIPPMEFPDTTMTPLCTKIYLYYGSDMKSPPELPPSPPNSLYFEEVIVKVHFLKDIYNFRFLREYSLQKDNKCLILILLHRMYSVFWELLLESFLRTKIR